jgi:hypothetical protein|tara:strand:- start:1622 stop:1795 length:174 start_codon:yes stop_codon:yes gene_type:complete
MGCETRKGGGELAFNEGVSFVRNTFSSPLVISGNSNGIKKKKKKGIGRCMVKTIIVL